jgi:multidrug efflux system membrane fusion protein
MLKAAEATLAAAQAEHDRGVIRAPWSGVIADVPVEVGQAALSFMGKDLVTLVALDPMLAVVEVSERKLAGIKIGDEADVRLVTGEMAHGKVRFVSKTASNTTRTYRVEVEVPNPDGSIPDGITAEVALPVAPKPATRVPRSALTISSGGEIGVRSVDDNGVVGFLAVSIAEDEQNNMWVNGIRDGVRVIVQGQDFVREGQKVEPVESAEVTATTR